MTESLIAGAVVFNGMWLPYNILKQQKIYFVDVTSIQNIPEIFEETILNFDSHVHKAQKNAEILDGFICGKENVARWEKAFGL
jgi:phenylalanine-4-hydroxylase